MKNPEENYKIYFQKPKIHIPKEGLRNFRKPSCYIW